MATLTQNQRSFLIDSFESRITFDRIERKIYGHDIGDLPRLIKPLLGKTLPEAVVQPSSEKELVALINWARENRIPLTPRGKATSGYGGVIPVKQGIVVDFYRMSSVISIDKENSTVTVEPGIIWENLDNELAGSGLTLCLYPTSYMSSSVGGWLSMGGAGIGSFESGWFREKIVSTRIVLPNGEVKEMKGDDLDMVSDVNGITGIISQVTLKVMPLEAMDTISIKTDTPESLSTLAQAITDEKLPIWSILFINPKMADFKNQSPVREHLGHPAEEKVSLPVAYIATLTFRAKDGSVIRKALPGLLEKHKGEMLDKHIGDHEWENRFKVMLVKRLGPSLVPAEVVIPLSSLSKFLNDIQKKIAQPIVKEGILVKNSVNGEPEVVILGFIPADQRKFNYHFVFSLSLSIMKIAEKCGGRAYATGLYFTKKASVILGKERLARLKAFKKKVDPEGIMNPGKVLGSTTVSSMIGTAGKFEGITRAFGNSVDTEIGPRGNKPVRKIPADIAWHAYSCSQCGYCVDTCDQYYGRGWESQSPRGKWFWLREYMEGKEDWNQKMIGTILACTTCEMCNTRCSENLPIESSWMRLRGQLIEDEKRMTIPPMEMMAETFRDNGNIWAQYRENRADWFPEDMKEKHGPGVKSNNVYFAGCTGSYVEPDIGIGTVRLMDAAGIDFTYVGEKENCCGTPMLVAGKWELFAENMKQNIKTITEAGADTVISSCPACDMMWRHAYPSWAKKLGIEYNIKAKHYSEVVSEKLKSGEFKFPENGDKKERVTWHDSCHMGRVSGIYEAPRDLIKANPKAEFVEMKNNKEHSLCCGSVLTLLTDPPAAAKIGKQRLDQASDVGADKMLALCPCCEFQLRVSANTKNIPVEVVDLATYSAQALGYELPDPNPEVKRQWVVFEKMIALMTPEGFADIMGSMWDELISAMPMGMGGMMRVMGKIPGALNLMKPMFPVLFPKLLPIMMPKVMPVMLEKVAERIPMPDYMKEQMPDLMPNVMASLMPHMIGDLVPLITQPLIDHLRGKGK